MWAQSKSVVWLNQPWLHYADILNVVLLGATLIITKKRKKVKHVALAFKGETLGRPLLKHRLPFCKNWSRVAADAFLKTAKPLKRVNK